MRTICDLERKDSYIGQNEIVNRLAEIRMELTKYSRTGAGIL